MSSDFFKIIFAALTVTALRFLWYSLSRYLGLDHDLERFTTAEQKVLWQWGWNIQGKWKKNGIPRQDRSVRRKEDGRQYYSTSHQYPNHPSSLMPPLNDLDLNLLNTVEDMNLKSSLIVGRLIPANETYPTSLSCRCSVNSVGTFASAGGGDFSSTE